MLNYIDTKNEIDIAILRLKSLEEKELSLVKEKETLTNYINKLNDYLKSMENNLRNLTGITNKLYYQIVVNGLNVTKAVDIVARDEDKDVSTIWKNYYPKIKDMIKR